MKMKKAESNESIQILISPKIPVQAVKTKDNVSNFITQNLLDAGEKILSLEKKGRRQQFKTKVTFSYEGIDILAKNEFNLFDQEVHDAVVTLYLADNQYITLPMVYRAMTGKTEGEYISEKKLKQIEKSVDKCMFSRLSIDASETSVSSYGYDKAVYSGSLLAAEKLMIISGGHRVIAYKILVEPLLYRYAKSIKQVSVIDIKLLDTPVAKRDDTIILQSYLLRQIESMKADVKHERTILLSDVYNILGITKEQRVQVRRIREYINDILVYWVQNEYISSFEFSMKGKSYHSIIIFF